MMNLKNKIRAILLNLLQRIVNYLYEKEGATDFVIDQQVKVNELRNEYNIPDKSEFIYEDFVQ